MGLLYTQCLYNTGNQTSNMVMNSSKIIIVQAQNKCESGWVGGGGLLGGGEVVLNKLSSIPVSSSKGIKLTMNEYISWNLPEI